MPKAKAPKIDLINYLPSDPVSRERLKDSVNEAVGLLLQIRDAQEELKDIRSVEKETHHIDPKFLNTLIAAEFDHQYKASKGRKGLEEKLEQMNENDILFGRSAPIANATDNVEDDSE